MISLDSETTGLDLRAGSARPFFITSCNERGEISYWEAEVDPLTREPNWLQEDLDEIAETISPYNNPDAEDGLVLQNGKFDVTALESIVPEWGEDWQWQYTHDTLIAGHLLASNQPHDLTSMSLIYLGVNIKPLEDAIQLACNEARRIARSKYPEWKIASKGLEGMPSAKESVWAFDMWLPKEIARAEGYPSDHPWWTVLQEYSNADSEVTLPLFKRQEELMKERGLWEIYLERLKVLPVAYAMEKKGITLSKTRLEELKVEYKTESERAGRICTNIAKDYGYELELPKSGSNDSLHGFVFGCDIENEDGTTNYQPNMGLESPKKSKKTGKASFDKSVLEHFEATLPENSKALTFIKKLKGKRSRDTALAYMDGYEKFWIPLGVYNDRGEQLWFKLCPSLNATGTDTLRWSSQNPNEQNISKKEGFNIRYVFGPAPGREWWSCDAENIELRLPAYEAGEEAMIELFERPNDGPYFGSNHLLVCHILHREMFDDCYDYEVFRQSSDSKTGELDIAKYKKNRRKGTDVDGRIFKKLYAATWYQWVKNGNFAVQYGAMESSGTADRAYHVLGAQARIQSRLGKINDLNHKMIAMAERCGYVETMPDKTVNPERGYPLLCTRTSYGKILPTVPLSYHIQGTAMWWMCKGMVRCHNFLEQLNTSQEMFRKVMGRYKTEAEKAGYFLIGQIHDEMLFDFPKGRGKEPWRTNKPIIDEIRSLMAEGGNDIGIPTPVAAEYHEYNWSEGVRMKS